MICYVQDINGKPLMPIHKDGRVREKLQTGKARLISRKPQIIRLTYTIENPTVDSCFLGIDPGRTNIGLCVTDSRCRVLYASDVETRNKMIPKLILGRKKNRMASRSGERKKRQRIAIAGDKTGLARETEIYRVLPGCRKAIRCKVIKNTEAKFNNRTRPEGWLTPTANQLLETHMNAIHLVQKILPVSAVILEINKFAFMKLDNPTISGIQYQQGKLHGFASVKEAVSFRQNGKCLLCGKPIEHYHHIVPRGRGSENLDNIAGLCTECHNRVHKDAKAAEKLASIQAGLLKKYGALSVLNQIIPKLVKQIETELPLYVTNGSETKMTRNSFGLSKEHYVDAWCIAVSAIESADIKIPDFADVLTVKQFKRHDRAVIYSQHARTYKIRVPKKVCKSGRIMKDAKKVAAVNRNKAMDQKKVSLHELYESIKKESDMAAVVRYISKLSVVKSTRSYNRKGRMFPGTIFEYKKKRYVLSGNHGVDYYNALGYGEHDFKVKECRIVRKNAGLVYIH